MSKKEDLRNKKLYEAANIIQKTLKNGNYELVKWLNINNENVLYLINKGDKPWAGVYIQHLK